MTRHVLVACFILLATAPAAAQDPNRGTVSGGYSLVHDADLEETLHGWLAALSWNINNSLGIVGEVGRNSKGIEFSGVDIDVALLTYMVGPRLSRQASDNVTVFGQVLVGGARGSAGASVPGFSFSESSTEFAIQPGGGVDIWFAPNAGLRIGGDFRRIFSDPGTNEFRVHFGAVFGIR